MLTFRLAEAVAGLLPLDRYADELFDVTACYFPITFDPPPGDKIGITREALVEALQRSISASPKFAHQCMSMLLEKVTTSNDAVKLQTCPPFPSPRMACGCPPPPPGTHRSSRAPPASMLQTSLPRSRAFTSQCAPSSSRVLTRGSKRLRSAPSRRCARRSAPHLPTLGVSRGCPPWTPSSLPSSPRECGASATLMSVSAPLLPVPALPLRVAHSDPAGLVRLHSRVIGAAARGSMTACEHLIRNYGSAVLERLEQPACDDGHRAAYLESLDAMVAAGGGEGPGHTSPAQVYGERIADAALRALESGEEESTTAALSTLRSVAGHVKLEPAQHERAITGCVDAVLHGGPGTLCRDAADTAAVFASSAPELGERLALSRYMLALGGSGATGATPRPITAETDELVHAVAAMVRSADSLAAAVLPGLVQQLQGASDGATAYMLACGLGAVASVGCDDPGFAAGMLDTVMALADGQAAEQLMEPPVLTALVGVAVRCTRRLAEAVQPQFGARAAAALGAAADGAAKTFGACTGCAVLCQLPPASLGDDGVQRAMDELRSVALGPGVPELRTAAGRAVGALLNKLEPAGGPPGMLERLCAELEPGVAAGDPKAIAVIGWVAKALIVRGDARGFAITARLVVMLAGESGGAPPAEATVAAVVAVFESIMSEDGLALCAEAGAVVRIMQRQRLFATSLPALLAGYQSAAAPGAGAPFLRTVCVMLQHVPKPVLLAEIGQVLPVIMESLTMPAVGIAEASLSVVQTLIADVPDRLEPVVEGLVSLLLSMSRDGSLTERQLALRSLRALAELPAHRIFPLASMVLGGLTAVDDRKRLVRREAALCSSRWHLIGAAQ